MDNQIYIDIANKSANNFKQSYVTFISDKDFLKFVRSSKETISTLERCKEMITSSCKEYTNAHQRICDRDLQNILEYQNSAKKISEHIRYIQNLIEEGRSKIEEGRSSIFFQDDNHMYVSPNTVTSQPCATPARSKGGKSKDNDISPQLSDITGEISENSFHFSLFSGSGNTSNLNEELTKNAYSAFDGDSSAWPKHSMF